MHINDFETAKELLAERKRIEKFLDLLTNSRESDWSVLYGDYYDGEGFRISREMVEMVLEAAKAKNDIALSKINVKVA